MQRILVVDDDPAVTSLLKRGLSYEGFAVDVASSGTEGLEVARGRPPDLYRHSWRPRLAEQSGCVRL
jgi:DNA-binding response OmpR family regulator